MAYVASNKTASNSVIGRLGEIAKDAADAYRTWRMYRLTLDELQQLPRRELDDLGLNPANLRQAAYDATYGKAN